MKKDHTPSQADSLNTDDKKKWIEPQICAWEYVNLGLNINIGGADGGSKTSAT